ncbi:LAMI_0G04324g1_1 [Lachancea mirantina]|uniref:LAMI_0G04324g1_1 n=1 Tax=Lachancea mirantina TaxID=1230905 RepID=A0A1G4K8F3_9SACH|nr:LAMI_0G04324g1_1 [Lachancea mirantina]
MVPRIVLLDRNCELTKLWRQVLAQIPLASETKPLVSEGTLQDFKFDEIATPAAIVSPGNSLGFLGGGFDLALREFFGGLPFERFFRQTLQEVYRPVMVATPVPLQLWAKGGFEYIIHVPTVVEPSAKVCFNEEGSRPSHRPVFDAMWSALNSIPTSVKTLVVPGLCTGYAGVPIDKSCQAMWFAISLFYAKRYISSRLLNVLILRFLGYSYEAFYDLDGLEEECHEVGLNLAQICEFDINESLLTDMIPKIDISKTSYTRGPNSSSI